MKTIMAMSTILCGSVLLLSPMLFTHTVQPPFFIWAQIVGGALCSSGVGLAFFIVVPPKGALGSRPVAG